MLGTVLGIGAFVAVLGLSATASGQVSSAFSKQKASQVSVSDTGATTADSTIFSFPADADRRIERLNGVIHGGVVFPLSAGQAGVSTSNNSGGAQIQISISGASPGYLAAIDATMQSGTLYSSFAEQNKLQVAVLGAGAARQLGIHSTLALPTIFIVGTPYTVVGIIGAEQRAPGALNEIFLPISTARAAFGDPSVSTPASMLIETELGAAPIVSQQAALALRPDNPALLHSVPPPNTFSLAKSVSGSLTTLFLILAFVTLLIGAVGITNTTLVAVMERTPEIGLRRAIGARPIDIAAQIVMETAAVGSLGGLVGTSIGVMIVLFTAIAQSWTALMNPALTLAAPLIGALIGVLAGIYPAFRASRIQPIEALRK
jgi:putative ABC transport system permease protein